jgi:hypothetical protein
VAIKFMISYSDVVGLHCSGELCCLHLKGKRTFGRPRRRGEYQIKMDIWNKVCEVMKLAPDCV